MKPPVRLFCLVTCFFLSCLISYAQLGDSIETTTPSTEKDSLDLQRMISPFRYKDFVISSAFKPTMRSASKILFIPDLSSSVDSIRVGSYNYSVPLPPAEIIHQTPSVQVNSIGFQGQLDAVKRTQYFKVGFGSHGSADLATHLVLVHTPQKTDIRLLGSYQKLSPSNALYEKTYDADMGLFGRFYIKNKSEFAVQYQLNTSSYKSAYHSEVNTPKNIIIPHTYQELRVGFNNSLDSANTKFYLYPQISISTFDNNFEGLNKKQSEIGFFARIPMAIVFNQTLRLNIVGGYDSYSLSNDKDQSSAPMIGNSITRGSATIQYIKDNINGYIGMTAYGSEKYGSQFFPEVFLHLGFGKTSPFFLQALFTTKQYYQTLNSFQQTNPWIRSDSAFGNVLNMKSQGAIQYNVQNRINLRLSLEWNLYKDIKLVSNDYQNTYGLFKLLEEKNLSEVVVQNDYLYIFPKKTELGITITKTFASTTTYEKPYGRQYPLFNVRALFYVLPHLKAKASFYIYDKVFYLSENQISKETNYSPTIFSGYIEYAILKNRNLHLWMNLYNIFGQRFERWSGYSDPGFVFTAGCSLYL